MYSWNSSSILSWPEKNNSEFYFQNISTGECYQKQKVNNKIARGCIFSILPGRTHIKWGPGNLLVLYVINDRDSQFGEGLKFKIGIYTSDNNTLSNLQPLLTSRPVPPPTPRPAKILHKIGKIRFHYHDHQSHFSATQEFSWDLSEFYKMIWHFGCSWKRVQDILTLKFDHLNLVVSLK